MSHETAIAETVPTFPTLASIERVEAMCLKLPQVDMPLTHLFAPGIYWREGFIPAGTFAIGHQHKTEHINVLLSGTIRVLQDGKEVELTAPQVFKSSAGVRKAVFAVTDVRFVNVHHNPTDETDLDKLEAIFVEKSATYLQNTEPPKGQIT